MALAMGISLHRVLGNFQRPVYERRGTTDVQSPANSTSPPSPPTSAASSVLPLRSVAVVAQPQRAQWRYPQGGRGRQAVPGLVGRGDGAEVADTRAEVRRR